MKIPISSIDQSWFERLQSQKACTFKLHSIFERALNLEDEKGQLWTILVNDLPNAPGTLLVDATHFPQIKKEITVGGNIVYHQGSFGLGCIQVGIFSTTRFWIDALPLITTSILNKQQANLQSFLACTEIHSQDPIITYIYQQLDVNSEALVEAILQHNPLGIRAASQKIIGLGLGLTPSGDDRLLGLLFILFLYKPHFQAALAIIKAVIAENHHKTTQVSQWMLYYGASGRFNEWFIHYGRALKATLLAFNENVLLNDQEVISNYLIDEMNALTMICSIGSQSGGDMIAGMNMGMMIIKRLHPLKLP